MKTMLTVAVALASVALSVSAQDKAAPPKRIESGKNVVLEIPAKAGEPRRVRVAAEVCFREGALELLLCRKNTKEHEAILSADVDARDIHKALLAAGAKAGSPVKFQPKYEPAKGSKILVSIEYAKDGKMVTVPARQWVRDMKTKKELGIDWVFGGSQFFPDPEDKAKPPLYAANGGDVICVANFDSAMLDLPIQSTQLDAELQFEAFTDRTPPLGTKVTVILEPVAEKK
jgi:hypothetical protein